ncbi:hypothetical protein [Burkholderia cepacia]|uniref:hypothetical protein n=1 Tax=Burkholderia cepacia TaxID=292 RepID=UPI00298FA415|nr:hypothetical protein [Burkholderia cepacia]
MAEKTANPAFTLETGREKTEPQSACTVAVFGLVSLRKSGSDLTRKQARLHQRVDATPQHRAVRQLHAMRDDLQNFGVSEPRAVPSGDRKGPKRFGDGLDRRLPFPPTYPPWHSLPVQEQLMVMVK